MKKTLSWVLAIALTVAVLPLMPAQAADEYEVTVIGGVIDGGGSLFSEDEIVTITAHVPDGYVFVEWQFSPAVDTDGTDMSATTTSFLMPGEPVIATAIYAPPLLLYRVAVTNGTSTGGYSRAQDDIVSIAANPPSIIGTRFAGWSIAPLVPFTNHSSILDNLAYFTMPAEGVTATAVFVCVKCGEEVCEYDQPPPVGSGYTVLVLDTSASMKKQMDALKEAAIEFCENTLDPVQDPGRERQIAIVTFASSPRIISEFTNDPNSLESAIKTISAKGSTNMYRGLESAADLMKDVSDPGAIKNILLMSDGMANKGMTVSGGQFPNRYANAVLDKAIKLRCEGIGIATIGLINGNSESKTKTQLRNFLDKIQTKGQFYAVPDTKEISAGEPDVNSASASLSRAFIDAAETLNKASIPHIKATIWLSGPADIYISNGVDYISSAKKGRNLATPWGTIEFLDISRKIKKVTLYTSNPLLIEIKGTKGTERRPKTIDYAIEFHDENSKPETSYLIRDMPISKKMRVNASSDNYGSVILLCSTESKKEDVSTIDVLPYNGETLVSSIFTPPQKRRR